MCEEVGHAMSLAHRDSSPPTCMSQQWHELHLDGHYRGHLGEFY